MTEPELVTRWWGRGNKLAIEKLESERDGMLHSGMEGGMNQSYDALDRVLATL